MHKKTELERQIKAYNLQSKLAYLAKKDEERRPFRHLPKQFSKGILIGNIAIVPKKMDSTRFVYIIADMVDARIIHKDICLKQTAILLAHYLADGRNPPEEIRKMDDHFASKIFEIKNFKRFLRMAQQDGDDSNEFIYENKLRETNRLADTIKHRIQSHFDSTFRINSTK
jgi:hypothetical protein